MNPSLNLKGAFKVLLIPFVVLVSIYVVGLVIYSIASKNKKDPKYIYNINFNLYVIGIMIGTFCISMSAIYFIYKIKVDKVFDYKSFGYLILFFLGLIVMFVMFVRATRKNEKDEIKEYQKKKQIKMMVNEIKTTKIEKKNKTKKTEKKQKVESEKKKKENETKTIEIAEDVKVEEIQEKPKKNNKNKIKENDETIEIELL